MLPSFRLVTSVFVSPDAIMPISRMAPTFWIRKYTQLYLAM